MVGPVIMVIGLGSCACCGKHGVRVNRRRCSSAYRCRCSTVDLFNFTASNDCHQCVLKRLPKLLPIFGGIVAGYITSLVYGVVDFNFVAQAFFG
ncbi:hypothetical protein O9992_04290 [Vibrio lentus]|nr:hypothetical protein [Vibrio lentus]